MRRLIFAVAILGIFCVAECKAGQSCEEKPADPQKIMQGFELAQKVKLQLDNANAELAIIARVGQDLSKYHLRYSHLGIVRKDETGRWIVMHELNQCGTANSDLFNEGLANFFMDDPFKFESLLLIPSTEVQEKIINKLNSPTARQLHEVHYNMLAFPFSTRYQNSNQWALELMAASLTNDVNIQQREQAQAWLKFAGYQASTLEIPMMTRLGGRMFRANIAFDDQPFDRRMAGHIDTVTVDSIDHFLQLRDKGLQRIAVSYP
jgi:hypothetical protein